MVMSDRRCDRIASVVPNYYLFFVSDDVFVGATIENATASATFSLTPSDR